jgi:hypothetical protein
MADECRYIIDRANLHYVRKQASEFLCDLNERVTVIENHPQGGIVLDYRYTNGSTGTLWDVPDWDTVEWGTSVGGIPPAGYIAFDSLVFDQVTEVYINKLTQNGNDVSAIIAPLDIGSLIGVFEKDPPNNTSFFETTAEPIDSGSYYTIPVVPSIFTGQALPSVDEAPVSVHIIANYQALVPSGGERPEVLKKNSSDDYDTVWELVGHDEVAGVTPDQHHKEVHTHDGTPEEGGSIAHAVTTGQTVDDHHRQLHKLYGDDADGFNQHGDVQILDPLQERHVLAWNSLVFNPEFRMNWRGNWVSGQYQTHDVVLDNPYTMAANKPTFDRAAPQGIGDVAYTLPDIPAWIPATDTAVIYSGHYYVFTENVEIRSLRVWCPEVAAGVRYSVVVITNPNSPNPTYNTIEDPILNEGNWTVLGVDTKLVAAGTELLIYLASANSGGETTWAYNWTKQTSSNTATPTSGGWNTNVQLSLLRINWLDDEAFPVNHQLELQVVVDTVFEISQVGSPEKFTHYRVTDPYVEGGDFTEYQVTLIAQQNGGVDVGAPSQVRAVQPIPDPTKLVFISNYWDGNQPDWGTIQSFLQLDGVGQPVNPDNAYGVDIAVQRMVVSDDWDLVASFGGGGGGGESSPFPEAPFDGEVYGRDGLALDW